MGNYTKRKGGVSDKSVAKAVGYFKDVVDEIAIKNGNLNSLFQISVAKKWGVAFNVMKVACALGYFKRVKRGHYEYKGSGIGELQAKRIITVANQRRLNRKTYKQMREGVKIKQSKNSKSENTMTKPNGATSGKYIVSDNRSGNVLAYYPTIGSATKFATKHAQKYNTETFVLKVIRAISVRVKVKRY